MLFHSTIPLTVWRVSCCSGFNTIGFKLSVITVCLPVIFELIGTEESSETVCAIYILILWKHCLFPSSCLVSIGDLPSFVQINVYVRCCVLSPTLIWIPLFISNQFPLNARCLFIIHAAVSVTSNAFWMVDSLFRYSLYHGPHLMYII